MLIIAFFISGRTHPFFGFCYSPCRLRQHLPLRKDWLNAAGGSREEKSKEQWNNTINTALRIKPDAGQGIEPVSPLFQS